MSDVRTDRPGGTAPAARPIRRPPIEMRTVHRVLSLVAFVFMFYISVTGTWIQTLDLTAILSGKPESDLTMQSINEGRFGNGFYSALTFADWDGAPLPANVDVAKGFATTLAAFHKAKPDTVPAFVEMRVVDGRVVGQAAWPDPNGLKDARGRGTPMSALAFDVKTGEPVAASDVRGAYPGNSLRQTLKQWHRFWGPNFFGLRSVPGVYIELIAGITLWVLIITGLVMYFRLLKQRRKMKRPQLFWMTGDTWRSLHRAVAIAASVLLVLVAFSGTWLGFESVYGTFGGGGRGGRPKETNAITDQQAVRTAVRTLAAYRAEDPTTPIKAIRARVWYGVEEGAVVTGGPRAGQRVYNTATGQPTTLNSPLYPPNSFPFGLDVHEYMKHFHSGELIGLPARLLDWLAGLSLVFLSASGIWMYVDLWRKRSRTGRKGLFWR